MKKILFIFILYFLFITNINAENYRIISGNQNAKISIIAYESLTCSHCANFHKDIYPKLKKEYIDTGLAKIEFRHFPLDIAAFNASKITQCKKDQSLEILNTLYSNQEKWFKGNTIEEINTNLTKLIKEKKFNINFEKCINNEKIEDFVLNDRIEGVKKYNINATPTIIINDKKFEKSLNYKNLKETLEKLI
tara:strand:- start:1065 stop:1640 length:576 start_codon:yes stop_codon:yes gene_type:complete